MTAVRITPITQRLDINMSVVSINYQKVFPEGLPEKFEDLTTLQAANLVRSGAPRILFCLGELPVVHAAMSPEDHREYNAKVSELEEKYGDDLFVDAVKFDPAVGEVLFDLPEAAVRRRAESLLEDPANQGKRVLLVYGAGHVFADNFSSEDFHFSRVSAVYPVAVPGFDDLCASYSGKFPAENALRYYDQRLNGTRIYVPEEFDLILEEQQKIVDYLQRSEHSIVLASWLDFATPDLRLHALEFLDPRSLNGRSGSSVARFMAAIAESEALSAEGIAWMKAHEITTEDSE